MTDARKVIRQYAEKQCAFCKNAFIPNGSTQKYCKTCVSTHAAGLRASFFGISRPEYEQLLREQNNSCKLCFRDFSQLSSLQICVDHCHRTNVIRGILCQRCNTYMMAIDADGADEWLKRALKYRITVRFQPLWERK